MNWYKRAQEEQEAEHKPQANHFAGKIFFHGTSKEGAKNIRTNGVDNSKSNKGYFGVGFYLAEDFDLAKSNYADWAEDGEEGVVLGFVIKPESNILDLRESADFEVYQRISQQGRLVGRDDFDNLMVKNGVDGLYDNSFGGIVIYNPDAIYPVN